MSAHVLLKLYRGHYMSAHVLLNLINQLWKRIKCETKEQILDSSYHYDTKISLKL